MTAAICGIRLLEHASLVIEDAPEVVAVGKDIGLERQKRATGVDQVDAGEMILLGDFLRAQVLFDGHGVITPALDRGIVDDDDTFLLLDQSNTSNDTRSRSFIVVHVPGGERTQFQKRCIGIAEKLNTFAR